MKFSFDPTTYHIFFDDFDRYNAADWVLTTVEAGAGSATEAITDGDGGLLLITNDAADNDADFFQSLKQGFKWAAGKRLYFEARFKVSDATQTDIIFGLQTTDTTPLAVTDGIFFQKDDGDANLDFHIGKNSVFTDKAAVAVLANDTFVTIGFYYDGDDDNILILVNDEIVGYAALTNVPDDQELAVSFGIQNGEAVIKTMTVDYIFVAKER